MNIKKSIFIVLTCFSLLFQSCKSTIDVTNYSASRVTQTNYPINAGVNLSLSIIETGFAKTSEAFVFKGGGLFKKRRLSHVSVLIQHPNATFVFDTGLGSGIEGQFHDAFGFIDRQLFQFTKLTSLKETLIENDFNIDSIDFILPTHLHFDHASGIEDFSNVTVLTTKEEYEHAMSDEANPPAFIKEQYDSDLIKWKFIQFNTTPYEVFEESYDVFNDGTVILVKLPGHTRGSLGMFVNLMSGKRYFFTGDLTWAAEAFEAPSEKFFIARNKVDGDRESVKKYIVKVHQLLKEKPEIKIIPAHDFNAQKEIAKFPNVEH